MITTKTTAAIALIGALALGITIGDKLGKHQTSGISDPALAKAQDESQTWLKVSETWRKTASEWEASSNAWKATARENYDGWKRCLQTLDDVTAKKTAL